jgi:hypothetical protein
MATNPSAGIERERINQELAQSASLNPFAPPEQALADEVEKLREADLERSRATTEEARAQHDDMIQREAVRRQERQQQQAVESENSRTSAMQKDAYNAIALGLRLEKARAALPANADAWDANVNPELVRVISNSAQEGARITNRYAGTPYEAEFSAMLQEELARQTGQSAPAPQVQPPQPEKPQTFPDGSTVQLRDNGNGTWELQLITGEVFKGDPQTIMRKAGEAQVSTKRWGQQQRATAQQPQMQPTSQLSQQPMPDEPSQQESIADMWADQLLQAQAKRLGFSDTPEMTSHFENLSQLGQEWQDHLMAADFLAKCQDFPNDEKSINALDQIIAENRWTPSVQSMEAAHSLAVRRGMYQPLAEEPQALPSRPTAPPQVPGSNSPDGSNQGFNPWDPNVKMADLRAMAIRQQLDGRG